MKIKFFFRVSYFNHVINYLVRQSNGIVFYLNIIQYDFHYIKAFNFTQLLASSTSIIFKGNREKIIKNNLDV